MENGKNGFFVDSNPEDISQKLKIVAGLSEESKRQFKEEGRNTAQKYSTKRYGNEYNKLFFKCMQKKDTISTEFP